MSLKSFLRSPGVQGALARVLAAYLDFALKTTRWRFENRAPADEAVNGATGIIGCFWHGRIPLGPACREVLAHKPRKVMISMSPDGEFIVKTMERLSFPAIRGSSSRKDQGANAKGGSAAKASASSALAAAWPSPRTVPAARRRRWLGAR